MLSDHIAAHWTPNGRDQTVIDANDVIKFDFGTQINERIIDCAFTKTFVDKYDPAHAVGEECGIERGVRLCDIGEAIEVMESHVVEIDEGYDVKAAETSTDTPSRRTRSAGKSVPIVREETTKMEEGSSTPSKPSEARGRVHTAAERRSEKRGEAPRGGTRLPSAGAGRPRGRRAGARTFFFPLSSGFGVFSPPGPGPARPERPFCFRPRADAARRTGTLAASRGPWRASRGVFLSRPSDDADGSASTARPTWHHSTTRRHPRAPVASFPSHLTAPHRGGSGA